jgi:hypothetical protein
MDEIKNNLTVALVSTVPATMAAVIALAEIIGSFPLLPMYPKFSRSSSARGVERSYLFLVDRNIARSLKAVIAMRCRRLHNVVRRGGARLSSATEFSLKTSVTLSVLLSQL